MHDQGVMVTVYGWKLAFSGVQKQAQEHGSSKYRAEVLYFVLKERSIRSVFCTKIGRK